MSKVYNFKYEEVEKIGEGGFSKVFKARIIKSSAKDKMEIESTLTKDSYSLPEQNENLDPNKIIPFEETKEKPPSSTTISTDKMEFVALKKIKRKIVIRKTLLI